MYFDYERESKQASIRKIIYEIILWIVEIAVVILFAYLIIHFAIEKTTVYGESMQNTLYNNDKVIVNKFSYQFTKPKRFDVVVFKQRDKEHSYLNIKRIIGLPGETVQIKDGTVYINGSALEEPIETEAIKNAGLAKDQVKLDENEYFVLGDNRNNSEDSRFANIGNLLIDDIVGKVWVRTNNFNFVNKLNLKKEEK